MLSIDPLSEQVVPLSELGKRIGQRFSFSSVYSWARFGKKNKYTRRIVRLETIQQTSGTCTSVEAYQRFIEALNETE